MAVARPPLAAKTPGAVRLVVVANAAYVGLGSIAVLFQIVYAVPRVAVATRAAAVGTATPASELPSVVASANVVAGVVEARVAAAAAVIGVALEQDAWPPREQRHYEPSQIHRNA